jgi:hypothetical protein
MVAGREMFQFKKNMRLIGQDCQSAIFILIIYNIFTCVLGNVTKDLWTLV